tara:strand:+ start:9148 stop:9264 length:117 start_codon:yes stop_codon:yes gene_type:complete
MIFLIRFYVYNYIYEAEYQKDQAPKLYAVNKIIIELEC